MLKYEHQAHKEGFHRIVGIDEAGRGPLAGPVVAAAVSFKNKKEKFENKIVDSKTLTARQRERAFHEIFDKAYVGIGVISESVIDTHNILQATYHAMIVAVWQMVYKLPLAERAQKDFCDKVCLLVDGRSFRSDLPFSVKTIVGGDDLSLSIAGASIIAKVTRDRILTNYDQLFPEYGFKQHKGYPTKQHRQAIRKYGPTLIHRKTFSYLS